LFYIVYCHTQRSVPVLNSERLFQLSMLTSLQNATILPVFILDINTRNMHIFWVALIIGVTSYPRLHFLSCCLEYLICRPYQHRNQV
jgi:hypothetical protein